MDIDLAIEAAAEVLDQNPAMSSDAAVAESLEFAQGIAYWAETAIDALRSADPEDEDE